MTNNNKNEEAKKVNESLYADYRTDLLTRMLSNSEKYDSAILSLSMAALGVSFTFITDIVKPENAINLWALQCSWVFFGFSIVSVIFSFRASNKAISKHIDYGYNYYIKGNQEYAAKRSCWTRITEVSNNLSGLMFIFAVCLTIFFVTTNFKKENFMSDKKEFKTTQIDKLIEKGADIPNMQPRYPLSEGADIPNMQPAEPIDTTGNDSSGDE